MADRTSTLVHRTTDLARVHAALTAGARSPIYSPAILTDVGPFIGTAATAYVESDPAAVDAAPARRGLERDGYVLFLSRVTRAKGVRDLIEAYAGSRARERVKLVIAGRGTAPAEVRQLAAGFPELADRVVLLTDVDDDEKPLLMRGCATYALPTKPEPDFVETFGIALAEKLLTGGGPVITTLTGGTGEAVGDAAVIVEAGDVAGLRAALDRLVLEMSDHEKRALEWRGREHALAFDRARVFDGLFRPVPPLRLAE